MRNRYRETNPYRSTWKEILLLFIVFIIALLAWISFSSGWSDLIFVKTPAKDSMKLIRIDTMDNSRMYIFKKGNKKYYLICSGDLKEIKP